MERLEDRALLSVTPLECDALRDANPEISLPVDRSEINLIELPELTNAAPEDRSPNLSVAGEDGYAPAPNDWVEENYVPTLSTEANDLIGVNAMKADSRFSFADGSGFATVIIDTGINLTHNYFKDDAGKSRIVYSYDFTGSNDADATDYDGHGANVAGIAAGRTGVANDADIIALKVFPDEGGGARGDDILEALRWCVDNAETYNIASVNMSLGSGNYAAHQNGYYTAVIDELADMGVIVCIAAGNDFYKNASALGVASPAATESAVCVSATFDANEGKNRSWASGAKANSTAADQITPFSQRHPYMTTIMAPGAFMTSAGIGSDSAQATMTGTSQASPVVAGAAVLAQQIANHYLGRSLTVDEFKAVIRNTGVDICDSDVYNDGAIEDDNVNNNGAWYKRLDVYAMAEAIYGMSQTSLPNFAASESIVVSATSGSASDSAITSTDVAYVATSLTATGSFSGSATATLKLTDAGGVVVKEFAKTVGQAGTFSWNESLGTLAAGEYTLTLTVDSGRTYDERSEIDNVYAKKFAVVNEKPSLAVTTASDVVDDADGQISLREAIAYADSFPTLGGTITFASALKGQTIALNGAELALSQAVTIDASALCDAENGVPGLTLDAGGLSRVFFVTGGTAENPVELIGLKIANGSAPHGGGVMVYAGAAFSAKDCVFVGNQTTNTGGGGICVDGWAALENCVASGNSAATDGGGIYVAASGSLTATETTISGNAATNQGGGLYVGGTATLENATVSGNSADWGGGAIVWGGLTLANSLVVENSATSGGGGFYVGGTATLRNATIAANKAVWGGGLQVGGEGTTTLYNAILATNDGGDVSDGATLNAYNVLSGFTAWDAGSNNYVYSVSQPLFVDAANGDYRLAENSQALDKGNDAYAVDVSGAKLTTDLAGNARFNGTVDLGAFELRALIETPSLVVTTSSDVVDASDGLISLREAILYADLYATLGDTITFDASLKGATLTLAGTQLEISKAIKIDASALWDATNDAPGVTLNANGKSRVFNVSGGTEESPVELLGLTITGGVASYAGGVFVAPNAFLSARNVVFTGNKTTLSGGGGLCVDGAASLENCDFIGNQGGSGGGICVALTASLTVEGGSFVDNVAAGYGGGGVEIERDAKVAISNATFTGNSAAYGGALHVVGSLTADNLTINGNTGTGSAGVDVDANGTLTLENSTITNNTATNAAGGLYVGGRATVRGVTISGNSAADGGGVYVAGTLTATDVTITGNTATNQGGGLYVGGTATLENATISGNSATWGGGAIVWGNLNLANTLVVENAATSGGGGFYVGGTATFRNATIAANKAGWGGGLQVSNDGTATLYNAILATNVGGDVSDGATLNGYNVLSSHTTWDAGSNNYVYNASQHLFKDAANGDYALGPNSQALDKGNNAYAVDADGNALTTDLAGKTRVVGGTVDLGAYEYVAAETPSAVVTTNLDVVDAYDGKVSLREAISYAEADASLGVVVTFDASLKGATITLSGTELTISKGITVDASALYDATTQTPGITIDADEKSRVFYVEGGTEENPVALIGLTITGGNTNRHGGGIYAYLSNTTLANCVVGGNTALNYGYGGGIYAYYSDTTLTNCAVNDNMAQDGGGVYVDNGAATLTNCVVSGNTVDETGGGICAFRATATLTSCVVSGNATSDHGGGVYVYESVTTLTSCVVGGNTALNYGYGGGIYAYYSDTTLTNSVVSDNAAGEEGGGVYTYSGATTFTNCVVSGNTALNYGGGIYAWDNTLTLYNSIVALNTATSSGADVYDSDATIEAYNTLSSYTSWDAGSSNYAYDSSKPLFVDAANGDYRLAVGSQAINKGNNSYISGYATDLAGNTRVVGGTVDLGAYELFVKEAASTVVTTAADVVDAYDGWISLREAISYAKTGGVVTFDETLKGATITLAGAELKISKGLTIQGLVDETGAPQIAVDANGQSRVFHLAAGTADSPIKLIGLTITGGAVDGYGGGVRVSKTAFLENCVVVDCSANFGGGVSVDKTGVLTVDGGSVSENAAKYGAGLYVNGVATLRDADFAENVASVQGGGLYVDKAGAVETVNVALSHNTAPNAGGGLYLMGRATFNGGSISGNTAPVGAGASVYSGASATFSGVEISENVASNYGGGVRVSGTATFENSVVRGNEAAKFGGGVYVDKNKTVTFDGGSVSENFSNVGGGFFVNGSVALTNVALTANEAKQGAGMYVDSSGTANAANVALTGNAASNAGGGAYVAGNATFANATFADNAATYGAGANVKGVATFRNAIVADALRSTGTANGTNVLSSFTAWANASDAGVVNFVYDVSQPLFKDAANGDYRLAVGSQAIDRGNAAYAVDAEGNPLTTDLAGEARVVGTAVDLGAYEFFGKEAPSTVVTTAADVVDAYDGWISLREAIQYAEADASLGGVVTFDETLKGATITLAGTELGIRKAIKVDASSLYDVENDVPGITVDADQKSRVFNVSVSGSWNDAPENTRVELNGLTITGGYTDGYAGGVYAQGSRFFVDFKNVAITANSTGYRSGYYFDGGGVYASIGNGGGVNFTNVKITENTASSKGGGVYLSSGSAVFTDVEIVGNTAIGAGGVWNSSNVTSDFTNVTIADNVASSEGGGGVFSGTGTFTNVEISGNTALSGGGVKLMGTFNFANVAISENVASLNGGGVYITSYSPTFTNVKISGNIAGVSGGGVLVNSVASPTFTNVEISGNTARDNDGGGVYVSQGTPNFVNVKISNNSASGSGGGVHVNGGSPNFTNVEISKNTASAGGGVSVINSSSPTFTNVAIVDNIGLKTGGGVYSVGSPTFRNVTIAGNGSGTAITCEPRYANALTTFYNSIIVGEVKLGESTQTPASALAYNTMSHYTYCWINGYDEDAYNCGYDASKQLFVDAANGDYRLAVGSQAIDRGNAAYAVDAEGNPLTTDLAGEARVVGTAVDLGAYERQDDVVSSARLTSEAFADAFDELDFFVDEDDLDALAKRLL